MEHLQSLTSQSPDPKGERGRKIKRDALSKTILKTRIRSNDRQNCECEKYTKYIQKKNTVSKIDILNHSHYPFVCH